MMSESIEVTPEYPSVAEFYAKKCIFITGATGFIGKVMLEKLLSHCKDIETIFILVRDKHGVNATTRIDELINVPIFETLKKEAPQQFNKIKPIVGDITKPRLGISDEDLKTLIENVSVVFHVAAALNFTDSLRKSFTHNVIPTREVMSLCHFLKKLQVLVYVSTAYAIMNRSVIDEKVYEIPADIATIEYMANNDMDKKFKKEILGDYPNTYVYTKLLAEHIVRTSHKDIPVAIVRPSVVTASLHGPHKGWMDNYNAGTMNIAAIQTGAAKVILHKDDVVCDLVPVDLVANFLIVCATRITTPEVKVYNYTSGASNPTTWGDFSRAVVKTLFKNANTFPWPAAIAVGNKYVYLILAFLFQLVPAYFIHLMSLLIGRKSKIYEIQKRLMTFSIVTYPFVSQQWFWSEMNVRKVMETMSTSDKDTFDIDVKNINWKTYFVDYVLGVKKYLLKVDT